MAGSSVRELIGTLRAHVAQSWRLLLAIGLGGIAVSTAAFFLARNSDDARVHGVLDLRAESRARDVERKMLLAVNDAGALASLMATQRKVDADDFRRFAELEHEPGDSYASLMWAPWVKAEDRSAFIADARREVAGDYDLVQRVGGEQFIPAPDREAFLPIFYLVTFEPRLQRLGIDLMTIPERREAVLMARDEGRPIASPPATILSSVDQALGFLVYWPVYAAGAAPATLEGRRDAFRGVVVANFSFDHLFPDLIADTPAIPEAIDFYIDPSAATDPASHVAHFDPTTQRFDIGTTAPPVAAGGVTLDRDFDILGRKWTLESHFPANLVAGLRSPEPSTWFIFGLILTVIALLLADRERWRRVGVETLVFERTAALSREIGERREAEQSATRSAHQLARSQQQLGAVLDSTVDGIVTIDEQGMVLSFSKSAERIFGYRADEVVGRNVKMLLPEPYRSNRNASIAAYLRTGVSKILGAGREVMGRRKDGSEFPMDLGVGEIAGGDGRREFVGTIRDITERVAAEQELRRSQALLKAMFNASPVAIIIRDTNFKILLWNRAAEVMFGYAAEEVVGEIGPIGRDQRPDEHFIHADRIAVGETIRGMEEERRRKDGSILNVSATGAPIYIAGEHAGFLGIIEDITERKAMERQLVQAQKMDALGGLTGGLAHDFNNLLGVIIGNLDLLAPMLTADAQAAELSKTALEAALHGAELTRRLLAFARRQPLRPERLDLNAFIVSTGKLLGRMLDANIRLSLNLDPAIWPVVVDPIQLEASLLNIATNARDAMPQGGALSIVTKNCALDGDYCATHPYVSPGDYAMIEASDTGTGMSAEVKGRIFEPFYTTKEKGKGTGLGLSMVFGFIKQSGGHINVYSEVGEGTTFRLYLPRNEGGVRSEAVSEGEDLPISSKGETVLVVEDNEGLRRIVVRQLVELGYRAREAADSAAAIALLESEAIDLLFTDIVMPGGVDGYELARLTVKSWPHVKVILTSGFPGAKTDEGPGFFAPWTRLLTKPYRKIDLARILRVAFDAAPAQDDNRRKD